MNLNWRVETTRGNYAVKQITDVPVAKVRRNLGVLSGLATDGLPVPVLLATADGETVVAIGGPLGRGALRDAVALWPPRASRLSFRRLGPRLSGRHLPLQQSDRHEEPLTRRRLQSKRHDHGSCRTTPHPMVMS
ncbi:hypothetical protein ACFVRE_43920, partial [Streptomyces sp. NPDC057910]